jgi:hypothetical protein
MDVAALELNANVNAYADAQRGLSQAMSGAQPLQGAGGVQGMNAGINQIASSMQAIGILNAEQAKGMQMLAATLGLIYASFMVMRAMKALANAQTVLQLGMAAAETARLFVNPIIAIPVVAAAAGAVIGMQLAFNEQDRTIEAQSIASGTERRRLARAVAP